MVIDAAKGVEAQTIKLLNVCRLRDTPIVTFMNKYDREVRDSLELLDEVENILEIRCAPVTWPIGMGKTFRGVYHLLNDQVLLFDAGGERLPHEFDVIDGIDNPRLDELFPLEIGQLRNEIELVKAASNEFDLEDFLAGKLTPVFFGSAINNFGVKEILDALIGWLRRRVRVTPPCAWSARTKSASPVSCSRSKPTWTRSTATASPSCACARASSSAA